MKICDELIEGSKDMLKKETSNLKLILIEEETK